MPLQETEHTATGDKHTATGDRTHRYRRQNTPLQETEHTATGDRTHCYRRQNTLLQETGFCRIWVRKNLVRDNRGRVYVPMFRVLESGLSDSRIS